MQLLSGYSDRAERQMSLSSLPGLPAGYNSDGTPILVTPAPTGVTPDNTQPGVFSQIAAALPNIVTAGLTAYQAIKLQEMQQDLIRQGRPPMSAYEMAAMAPQLRMGLTPDTQNALNMALLAGGGALLLFMLMKRGRG